MLLCRPSPQAWARWDAACMWVLLWTLGKAAQSQFLESLVYSYSALSLPLMQ